MLEFYVGEKVVHNPEGVCVIVEVCQMVIDNVSRMYLKLCPVMDDKRIIYIPAENNMPKIRKLKSKSEVKDILSSEPEENLMKHLNSDRKAYIQKQAIREDNSNLIMKLIKLYHKKQKEKRIPLGEATWLKEAEQYLFSEISEVLNCNYYSLLEIAKL